MKHSNALETLILMTETELNDEPSFPDPLTEEECIAYDEEHSEQEQPEPRVSFGIEP